MMPGERALRVGDIFWFDDCPPLEGDAVKRRPVVIVGIGEIEAIAGGVLAVACTSSAYPSDLAAFELPSHSQGRVRSGLWRRTWAVPNWIVVINRGRLGDRAGYISGAILDRVVAAFLMNYRLSRGERNGKS